MSKSTGRKLSTPRKTQQDNTKKIILDNFDFCAVHHMIHNFHTIKKHIPTLQSLLSESKSDINFKGGKETVHRITYRLGFLFKKCKNKRSVLMETNQLHSKQDTYKRLGGMKPVTIGDLLFFSTRHSFSPLTQ